MRLAALYLRSRRAGRAAALIALIAAGAWGWRTASGGAAPDAAQLLVIPPLGAATVIAAGIDTPFGEGEAGRALAPLRLLHLIGLAALAALGLAMASGVADWAMVRNVAGLTGLALLAARLFGTAMAWVAPLCCGIYALGENPASLWTWPVHAAGDGRAAAIAIALLLLGLGAGTTAGGRGAFRPERAWVRRRGGRPLEVH